MKLLDIRFLLEREIKEAIENEDIINWANQVNADVGVNLNLPATGQIHLNTTEIEYPEPAGIKVINRLWLQSDFDSGLDREFTWSYRRYNGKFILARPFSQDDTLNVDFYKHLTYFTDIGESIDLDDRYTPLYTFYGLMKYYKLPSVIQRLGEAQARQEAQSAQGMYLNMKQQVTSLYALNSEPTVIKEAW